MTKGNPAGVLTRVEWGVEKCLNWPQGNILGELGNDWGSVQGAEEKKLGGHVLTPPCEKRPREGKKKAFGDCQWGGHR